MLFRLILACFVLFSGASTQAVMCGTISRKANCVSFFRSFPPHVVVTFLKGEIPKSRTRGIILLVMKNIRGDFYNSDEKNPFFYQVGQKMVLDSLRMESEEGMHCMCALWYLVYVRSSSWRLGGGIHRMHLYAWGEMSNQTRRVIGHFEGWRWRARRGGTCACHV